MVVPTPLPFLYPQGRSAESSACCTGQCWWCAVGGESPKSGVRQAIDVFSMEVPPLHRLGGGRGLEQLSLSKDQFNQRRGFKSGCYSPKFL